LSEVHEISKYASYTITRATCDSLAEGVISLFYIQLKACRGVDKFFQTLAKLASRPVLLLAKTENNWAKI
jgi:hypothetical protein